MAEGRKKRVKVPKAVEAEVLFANDHTCCKCHDPSKSVLIHHINGDPSDNRPENLAVVCTECNTKIEGKSPVSKGYSPAEVRQYKRLWEQSVAKRREYLAVPRVKEKVREIDLSSGVERYIEREVPYTDGLAPKAFLLAVPAGLPRVQLQTLEEARRIIATELGTDRLASILEAAKRDREADRGSTALLSRLCLAVGDSKFHSEEYDTAEAFYREALVYAEAGGESAVALICLYELGAALGMQGKRDEALHCFNRVIFIEPTNHGAWHNKGLALAGLGRTGAAISALRRATDLATEAFDWAAVARTLSSAGIVQAQSGRHEEAIESCLNAIEMGTKADQWDLVGGSYLNMGNAHSLLGRHEEAVQSYLKAIEAGTRVEDWDTVASAYYNMGNAQAELGRHEEAIESCRKAMEIGSRVQRWDAVARAHYNVGNAQARLGKPGAAIESYRKAIDAGCRLDEWSTVASAYYNMGNVQGDLGRPEKAIESYLGAIDAGTRVGEWGTVARAYCNMGLAQAALGRQGAAIESYLKAIEVGTEVEEWGTVASAYGNMGLAQGELGSYAKAILSYLQAIEIGSKAEKWGTVADAYANMGAAQGELGSHEDSIESCAIAITMGSEAEKWDTVARAHYNVAAAQGELGRYDEAIESCLKAMPIREFLPDRGARIVNSVTLVACHLGVQALREQNLPRAKDLAQLLAEVHSQAQDGGTGQLVLHALDTFASTLANDCGALFERFRQLVMDRLGHPTG